MKGKINPRNEQLTLGVLHYLLNTHTQIPVGLRTVLAVMNAIEKISPLTMDVAHGEGKIIVNGKTVFSWNANCINYK